MPTPKFKTADKVIIVLFFALYMLGYHFLMSSGSEEPRQRAGKEAMNVAKTERIREATPTTEKKSLQDWPLDLGKYFYTIDISPGYEIEGEEWVEVEKVGDHYYAKRENDWPDISGHFEWYCNERLTSTQQLYDYVVAHRQSIIRQMEEMKKRRVPTASDIFDEPSYYQDHYDEYQDDPEDEIRFPPEIFDAN